MKLAAPLRERLARVRLLALDADGVLTDGSLVYGPEGEALAVYHVRDGLGLRLLRENGVHVAVITARGSAPLGRRLAELGISHYLPGRRDKWRAVEEVLKRLHLQPEQTAFAGDDVLDLGAMRHVGLAIAVRDAHPLVTAEAHWTTEQPGGRGAVREIADAILESRGVLAAACEALLKSATEVK